MKDDLWIYAGSSKTTDANDKEPVELNVAAGNMFWADDQSGQDLDIQFAVNGKRSPSLPKEFTPKATLIPNTIEGTCNSLELYVNGQDYTILEKTPTDGIKSPGDLRAAILTCPVKKSPSRQFLRIDDNSDNEYLTIIKADSSLQLPENKLGETYNIDDVSESVLEALFQTIYNNSLLQNTIATTLNEGVNHFNAYEYYKEKYGLDAAKGYLKEFISDGRFTVKKMSQWGGGLGVAFKGNARKRKFLTSVNYGIKHDKMAAIRSYVEVSAAGKVEEGAKIAGTSAFERLKDSSKVVGKGAKTAAKDAIPFRGGNIIGLVFATAFDVYDFFKKDVGEQNIAAFAGALGVTSLKVFAATFMAIGAVSAFMFLWGSFSITSAIAIPTILVLSLGVLASISFGWGMDYIDTSIGLKSKVMTTLEEAFPDLNTKNMLESFYEESIKEQQSTIDQYIGEQRMKGTGMFGF